MHFSKVTGHLILSIALAGSVTAAYARSGHKGSVQLSKQAEQTVQHQLNLGHELFVQNKGQWDSRAQFLGQSPGVDTWLNGAGMRFDYYRFSRKGAVNGRLGQVVDMRFAGASPVEFTPDGKVVRTSKFMSRVGHPFAEASSFQGATARNVYPGIDLHAYFQGSQVRYDWILHPGADASKIQLNFVGSKGITTKGSKLTVDTQVGAQVQGDLFAYQMVNGKKQKVDASFASTGKDNVGFSVAKYDHSKALVIDPVVYGTYFGGNNGWDDVRAVVADNNGGVYLTGMTRSTDYPITDGPYFSSLAGTQNAYLAKLQGDAYNVDYSVFFGGTSEDYGQFIQLDPIGNVWVAGITTSPTFNNVACGASTSAPSIFLARFQQSATDVLDPTTNPAIYFDKISQIALPSPPYHDTKAPLRGFDIVADPNATASSPVTLIYDGVGQSAEVTSAGNPANNTYSGGMGFIVRLTYSGGGFSAVTNATECIGEGLPVDISGLAVDAQGNSYVTGQVGDGQNNYNTATTPNTFTTTANVFTNGRLIQKTDLFARKYDAAGTIIYSAIVGGSGNEGSGGTDMELDGVQYVSGSCIAVDSGNNVYITGVTSSFDYPRTRGVFGEIFNGYAHDVVTKISNDFSQILYSTSLNTGGSVVPSGIAVDGAGRAFVTGMCLNPMDYDGYTLGFPFPPNDPLVPTSASTGTVPTHADSPDTVADPTYDTPTVPEDPTSEGYLLVLNPTATALQYGTYLGGKLDEHVFGPYVDNFGDVWVPGATCANRVYVVINAAGTSQNVYQHTTGNGDPAPLPATLITDKAYKSSDLPDSTNWFDYNINYTFAPPPFAPVMLPTGMFGQWFESRDGFLVKFRIDAPIIQSITVTPGTVPGGGGQTSMVQVTLDQAAPAEGATINLTLDSTTAASFSSSSASGAVTIQIPAGATTFTSPVPIYTSPVSVNTQVLVKADYQGNYQIAPLVVVPWLQNFTLSPSTVVGGNPITGTITLAQAAPSGGLTVNLHSSDSNLVVAGGVTSVTIPAGQTTGSFAVNTLGVDNKDFPAMTATLLNKSSQAQVELDPAQMLKMTISPNEAAGGSTFTGTIQLTGLPGPSFPAVAITVSNTAGTAANYVVNPSSLTFASGSNTATFTVVSPFETSQVTNTVTATMPTVGGTAYQAQTLSQQLIVDVSSLLNFTITPTTTAVGQNVTGTVTLAAPAGPGGTPVLLSSDNPTLVPVPAQVTVGLGASSQSVTIPVANVAVLQPTVVNLTASRGTQSITQQLTVQEATVSLSVNVNSILGGNKLTGTVTLSAPAAADTTVTFGFSPSGVLSVPGTVVIPAGQTSVDFEIDSVGVTADTMVSMTATAGSVTSSPVVIDVTAPALVKIAFYPPQIRGGRLAHGIITLDGPAPAGGLVVQLDASPHMLVLPITVTVPAGATSAMITGFAVPRVSRRLAVTVTATSNGNSVFTILIISR